MINFKEINGAYSGELDTNNNKIYFETSMLRFPDGSTGILRFDRGQLAAYFSREDGTCIVELEGVNNHRSFYLRDCSVLKE